MINHIISECSKLSQKEYKTRHNWVGKVIHKELCKKIEIWPYEQMVYAQPRSVLENETHKPLWDFDLQRDHQISARWPDLIIINKKEGTCWFVDFAVPADYRVKLKECEKRSKFFNLARELKKLWNMKVMVIPIVTGALGTVTEGLVQRLEDLEITGQVETVQTTALLRSDRILRRVLETWGDLLSLKLQWKTIS